MKFGRIFPDSLGKKLLWLIAAFAALFAANFFAYDYLLYRLDQTAAAVDTAGRQRMLSQRIAYTAVLASAGRRGAESELAKLSAEFESALFALAAGGHYRDYYVYPAPPGILPLIKREAVLWRDYKLAAAALASSADRGRPSVRALYAIETLAGPLLSACDETTAAFRREAEAVTRQLYGIMVAIASALLLLGGAAVWFASRKVAAPLLAMAGMARRLPAEPFDDKAVAGAAGEVRTLAEALGKMSRQLALAQQAQKMEALGNVAGAVAHDFNNILTVVKGFNELVQESVPADSQARRYADQAEAGIAKGAELARQILDYSRTKPKARQSLDLNELLAGARPMLAMAAGSKVRLEIEPSEGVPKVEADKGQLEQVLMNLTINARDAMAPGTGRLTFRTFVSGGLAGLSVTDTGCGMAPEIAAKVFEPFFTTKPEGQGTGLGLATVYSIVKAHKGEIALQSAPGKGTTFTLTFPPRA